MSAPLVVNTQDGTCWTRRTVTSGGIALYAPERVRTCPEFVMATLPELAEQGIVGSADALPMPVGPEPQASPVDTDRAKAPWGRGEDGRPLLPMGAHWTDVPELVDRTVASIQSRVDEAQPGSWFRSPVPEAPDTVCTRYDGYTRAVGRFLNVLPGDLELILHAHQDLGWCLGLIAKLRAHVAEREKLVRWHGEDSRTITALVARVDRRQARLVGLQNDALSMRGSLAPADGDRKVPFELGETLTPAVDWLIARVAELEAEPTTVYRAEHPDSGITLGHYGTAKAARAHCETTERRSWPTGTNLAFDWIEDDEDRVAELVVIAGQNEESTTGYIVTALELDSEYDPDGDE